MGDSNDTHSIRVNDSGNDSSESTVELSQAILRSHVMLTAYAASVVILAIGIVMLILGLAGLSFFYPDKANAFLLTLGGPLIGILIVQYPKIGKITKILTNGKQADNKQ